MYEMGLRDDGLFHDVDDRDGTHYGRGKGLRIASEGSRGAAELYAQHTAATGRRSTCSSAIASPFLAQPIDNPFFCLI